MSIPTDESRSCELYFLFSGSSYDTSFLLKLYQMTSLVHANYDSCFLDQVMILALYSNFFDEWNYHKRVSSSIKFLNPPSHATVSYLQNFFF